jgi:hypothetical protein
MWNSVNERTKVGHLFPITVGLKISAKWASAIGLARDLGQKNATIHV